MREGAGIKELALREDVMGQGGSMRGDVMGEGGVLCVRMKWVRGASVRGCDGSEGAA